MQGCSVGKEEKMAMLGELIEQMQKLMATSGGDEEVDVKEEVEKAEEAMDPGVGNMAEAMDEDEQEMKSKYMKGAMKGAAPKKTIGIMMTAKKAGPIAALKKKYG